MQACKNDTQRVEYLSLDITENYEELQKALMELERTMGPIYMLVNCAGSSVCAKIEDTSISDVHKMVDLNFLGTYYCIKAVVQSMKTAKDGIIVLTSSQAGIIGNILKSLDILPRQQIYRISRYYMLYIPRYLWLFSL